jgi:putative ABC transport system substrate-binding protein
MRRRSFLAGGVSIVAVPLAASAQSPNPIRKLGYVSFTDVPKLEAAFIGALRRLGWEEGRNVVVERRNTQSGATLDVICAELVKLAPDVLVVPNAGIATMMRRETTTIPIVVLLAGDLVAPGLVESLARPGRNVTGTQIVSFDLMGKRLQLLQEVLGNPTRVAALWDVVTQPITPLYFDGMRAQFTTLAQSLRMQPLFYDVRTVDELDDRFRTMASQRAEGVLVFATPFMYTHARTLTALGAKYRIPAIYETGDPWVTGGGLMAYGVDFAAAFARGAVFVDKIFRGAKPAELPVEQPTTFELVINLKTAKALGLTIPPAVRARADEVIQ